MLNKYSQGQKMNTVFRVSVKSADVHVPKRRENNTETGRAFGFVNMF